MAQQFWEQRDERLSDGRFEGRLLAVTVIFSDTCDFTAPAERLKPAELLAWFNRDMALWVPAITSRGVGALGQPAGEGRKEPLDVWELRGSAPAALPASPHP